MKLAVQKLFINYRSLDPSKNVVIILSDKFSVSRMYMIITKNFAGIARSVLKCKIIFKIFLTLKSLTNIFSVSFNTKLLYLITFCCSFYGIIFFDFRTVLPFLKFENLPWAFRTEFLPS